MMNNILKLVLRGCICGVILAGSIWTFNFGLGDGPNPEGYAYVRSCIISDFGAPTNPPIAQLQERFMLGVTLFAGLVLFMQLLSRREGALPIGAKIEVVWPESPRNWVRRPHKRVGAKTSVLSRRNRTLML
jgi:hypothetical protein